MLGNIIEILNPLIEREQIKRKKWPVLQNPFRDRLVLFLTDLFPVSHQKRKL